MSGKEMAAMTKANDNPETKLSSMLKRLLTVIEASGRAYLPRSNDELLESIIQAAARIFHAGAASILLVNEQEKMLEFKVACGVSDRDLVGEKFPMNKGIAGYVVMTGQPLSISNVMQDARFNQDFAKSTGYVPKSILAMPMKSGERVIGVIEVLDKINADSFGIQDMELLGMFAHQAAISIDQSQRMDHISQVFVLGLKNLARAEQGIDSAELFRVLDEAQVSADDADLLEIAALFNQLSELGEKERKLCLQVLKAFSEYRLSMRKPHHDK
jgi:GAF domain-containing protein